MLVPHVMQVEVSWFSNNYDKFPVKHFNNFEIGKQTALQNTQKYTLVDSLVIYSTNVLDKCEIRVYSCSVCHSVKSCT